jgi:hypothetical protein
VPGLGDGLYTKQELQKSTGDNEEDSGGTIMEVVRL